MKIRHLPDHLINQIAAGEVLERPAAAVKEMVENAIDANATRVEVRIEDGGKSLIQINDNGDGMSAKDLVAALDRHATSKLEDNDLLNIQFLGFRGEALPSIASVARMQIDTRERGADAWRIHVDAGEKSAVEPSAHPEGTHIEVRDLFYATPARLKFQKSARAEYMAVKDILQRIAMAHPAVAFRLEHDGKTAFSYPSATDPQSRIANILGREFRENTMRIEAEREGIVLKGYASLPTYHRASAQHQYLFVNGRPVKDRLLHGCVRAAYADVLARDRHPVLALFLDVQSTQVDVNVHPAKTEVRFQDAGVVRGLIISALKHAIHDNGFQVSSAVSTAALGKLAERPLTSPSLPIARRAYSGSSSGHIPSTTSFGFQDPGHNSAAVQMRFEDQISPSARTDITDTSVEALQEEAFPLGTARAQLHENYIVAQTQDGIVIVDQHAAHERLVYEKFKNQHNESGVTKQGLLSPEIINLEESEVSLLLDHQDQLANLGLEVEAFGADAIAVQAIPALLGDKPNLQKLILDLVDEVRDQDTTQSLENRLNAILSTMACHGSIRSGRQMRAEEMNELLRQMEANPLSGQCNHGRPTYVTLSLNDIERLFGRK